MELTALTEFLKEEIESSEQWIDHLNSEGEYGQVPFYAGQRSAFIMVLDFLKRSNHHAVLSKSPNH